MKKYLDLKPRVLLVLKECSPYAKTTNEVINAVCNTHAADSRHPEYRTVLHALHSLVDDKQVGCRQLNRFTPQVWLYIGDIPF